MRALVLSCALVLAMGYPCCAQDQPLRGVFAPPGSAAPVKSSKPAVAAPNYDSAIGSGPRVTISGRATEGQMIPSNVNPAPISDRPGYGTAIVNGHRSIINLNDNRIVQVMD
jgi:hypothetical protein